MQTTYHVIVFRTEEWDNLFVAALYQQNCFALLFSGAHVTIPYNNQVPFHLFICYA